MQDLLRKYAWTMDFVFVAIGMTLLARSVNVYIEGTIRPIPDASSSASAPAPVAAERASRDPDSFDLSRLGIERPTPTALAVPDHAAEAAEPAEPEIDEENVDLENCPPTSLRLELVGTALSPFKYWSFAIIRDLSGGAGSETLVASRGDDVLDAEVLDVYDRKVVLKSGGRIECLSLDKEPAAPKPVAAMTPTAPPEALGDEGISKTGDNQWTIARSALDGMLRDMTEVIRQARMVPYVENGKTLGYKFKRIKKDSVFEKIGFRKEDVLMSINGFDVNNPAKVMDLYTRLQNASDFTVSLRRGGQQMNLDYKIR